ncbi:MAG: hypothetical protein KKI14_01230 [Nanoarchaeota archaeon]|nr:hypothetical protein [Nanoarchaeota archaeon]
MKETIKQVFVGMVIFLVGGLALLSIVDPYIRHQVMDTMPSISFGGEDILDVVKNPEKYEGKEILLKNTFITTSFTEGEVISAEELDGNFVHLKYKYYRNIYCGGYVDLEGIILNTKSQTGLIPVDENGNRLKGSYYFNVTEVKCRD